MLDAASILNNLKLVGRELQQKGTSAEIVLAGGAVMLLLIKSREITKDIDAYFGGDTQLIREAAQRVAIQEGLPSDWLNDSVKGFFYGTPPQIPLADFPGLRVYSVAPEYMVAMKALAGRTEDVNDLKALVRFCA